MLVNTEIYSALTSICRLINVRVCTRYIARVVTHDLIYVRVFTHDLIFVRVVTHDLIFVYVCCKRFDFVVHYTRFNSVRGVTHVILNVFFKTEWNKEKGYMEICH